MKIVLIGATGVIGKNILTTLNKQELQMEIITVSRRGPTDLHVNISSSKEIIEMYNHLGHFDAMICVAGDCYVGPFEDLTEDQVYIGIRNKMMGQDKPCASGQGLY